MGQVRLPASKSLSNRALLIHALCPRQGTLHNVAQCDDTAAMARGLAATGGHVNVGAAGTAMRFLTAFFATREGVQVTIDGTERMRQRPIGVLVDALRQLGADISYTAREGFPPLRVTGKALAASKPVRLAGDVSSQFVSALLMIAPVAGGLTLELTGEVVSRPYIEMTLAMMREHGVEATASGSTITVPAGDYLPRNYHVESDWSAASYWYAFVTLLPGSRVRLQGLQPRSLQGDAVVGVLMQGLGVRTVFDHQSALIAHIGDTKIDGFSADFSDIPDLAQTFVVLMCALGLPFSITGLRTLRIKETDRLAALQKELKKAGFSVEITADSIAWDGQRKNAENRPIFSTYDDHRMAMSLALLATRFPSIVIRDPQVVTKSYPLFWEQLLHLGFSIRHNE